MRVRLRPEKTFGQRKARAGRADEETQKTGVSVALFLPRHKPGGLLGLGECSMTDAVHISKEIVYSNFETEV